ncbi:MAG: hypothetical protein RR348_01820 [Clostridia bacterium]
MKVKIHPLFVIVVFFMLAFESAIAVMSYIVAILAHEFAHAQIARRKGYVVGTITLMPYGGALDGGEATHNKKDNIAIAIAGPTCNAVIATICVALWWLFPTLYNYTLTLCVANVSLAVVNILPFYPLDGSRIVISLSKNKLKSIRILKICTTIFGVALFVLGVCVMIFFKLNFTIAIFGIFLIYSAVVKSEQDSCENVARSFVFGKNFAQCIKKTVYYVDKDCELLRLVSKLNGEELCEFVVQDGNVAVATIKECDIQNLCLSYSLTDTLSTILHLSTTTKSK